jgi:hypothetical protein
MNWTNLIQDVFYLISLIGIAFLVWNSIQKGEAQSDKDNVVLSVKLNQLADQVNTIQNNHLVHLAADIKDVVKVSNAIVVEQTRLNTIIEERFPEQWYNKRPPGSNFPDK